jgi:hypothetical protein
VSFSAVGDDGEERVLVRTIGVWWIYAVFYGLVFLLAAGAALNPSVPTLGRLACGALACAIAVVMVKARQAGVEVTESHVTVRRYSGINRTVPWSDVAEFQLVPSRNGGVFVAVILRDGAALKTQGLVFGSTESEMGKETIDRLEGMRPRTGNAGRGMGH